MNGDSAIVLEGRKLNRQFGFGRNRFSAVFDVDFMFRSGEIISIVGESGSGKTTLAKMIMGLLKPTSGQIMFRGKPRSLKSRADREEYWKNVQGIFQDPFSSFNQFSKIQNLLLDCINLLKLKLTEEERMNMMREACRFVNLEFDELYNKYPFELSGGQMQRLMIARIFILKPKVLIADEPTSMIDACSRATILDMFLKLRKQNDMIIVFITHDLGLAYYVSDTIYIMEHGTIVERGSATTILESPTHSYTKRLLADVPKLKEAWDLS
jgi:peptide/nickel transport system ATP-binding protein